MDREASQKEREKDHPTYKDNDFLKDNIKVQIGEDAKAKVGWKITIYDLRKHGKMIGF